MKKPQYKDTPVASVCQVFLQTIYVKPPSIFRQKVLAKIKLYTILAKTAKINN